MKTIFLSPSDLAFLLDDSPWGFYQKYNLGIKRPPVILPKIFTLIDVLTKASYLDKNLNDVDKSLPDALLVEADQWVKSKPISNPDFPDLEIIIRGKIDGILRYSDDTNTVIDFKTCEISEKVLQKYVRQLSSYSFAITHPFSNTDLTMKLREKVGLFVFEPDKFYIDYNSKAGLKGKFKYVEYDINLTDFENYIKNEVIPLIAGKEPAPSDNDPCWVYLKQFGFEYEEDADL
jgi:hypothetical protein